jgi:hypothetical protein
VLLGEIRRERRIVISPPLPMSRLSRVQTMVEAMLAQRIFNRHVSLRALDSAISTVSVSYELLSAALSRPHWGLEDARTVKETRRNTQNNTKLE